MAERQGEFRTPRGGGETILRTSGLSKRFGNITAVHNLDLDVRAGEVLGFLGPNGSGKSTTVGMVLGLIEPTTGTVELFGKPLAQQREALTRQVGAIIETPAFYPYLSGRDNLRALAMAVGGIPASRIEELLSLVGLQERAGGKFKTYSLGMKQRLGIASTLLTNPSLVILDEPTNGLDPAGQREIRDLIPDLARQGHAVLLASHLLHEVEQVCERVAIIRSGRLIEFGRVADLVAKGGYLDVKLRPNEIAAAAQVLQTLPFVESVAPRDEGLAVTYTGDYGAEINRVLAGQGIFAAALIPRQSSLEDIFLELTEGSTPGEQNVQTGGSGDAAAVA